MKDYVLKAKVQNNRILTAMREKGFYTAAALCRAANVPQTELGKYLNLKAIPFNRKGEWSTYVLRICEVLSKDPEDLFSDSQCTTVLRTNAAETTFSEGRLEEIMGIVNAPEQLLLEHEVIATTMKSLDVLDPRERDIIRSRFGLESGDVITIEALGMKYDVTRERIRQIEQKALRKLRTAAGLYKREEEA